VDLARKSLAGLVAAACIAHAARAQNPPPTPPPPPADTTARRVVPAAGAKFDATKLQTSQFVYLTTLERDASTTTLGTRTVTVSPTSYVGIPTWLIVEARAGDGIPAADSLYADLATLRPIHWSATTGQAHLALEFRSDSAFGGTSTPAGRRTMALSIPPGTLVSGAMLETVLRLLPLTTAWEDSVSLLSIAVGSNAVLPTRIAVIGEDRVRVPAGTFDCWVVAVHADQTKGLYWVTKTDPIVVRSTLDQPMMGGAQVVSALARIAK
jgi:hypothetical protein